MALSIEHIYTGGTDSDNAIRFQKCMCSDVSSDSNKVKFQNQNLTEK